MHEISTRIARGAAAGVAGTAALSAVMTAGKAAGWVPISAPHEIAYRFHEKTGLPQHPVWGLGHYAYGAASGTVFFALRRFLPGPPLLGGLLYGLGVWAVSYLGLMPKLGLYPKPSWDKPSRRRTMIAGHAVFGLVLGAFATRRRAR